MLKQRTKLKTKSPRRQISRSRTNRSLLNRQRAYFLQNFIPDSELTEPSDY